MSGEGTSGSCPIRVLIADDDPHIRSALGDLVDGSPAFELVAVAADAHEACLKAGRVQPDVAVLDVRMPGGGHEAAREIRRCSPRTRVVAFSAYDDQHAVVGMVGSGAISYLTKGASGRDIVEAIQRAARGESHLTNAATTRVVEELGDQLQQRERDLLDRELQIARTRQGLEPGAIEMVYQPVFSLATRRRCGVEALARFRLEPPRTPDVWFAEAWEVGLGIELELAAVHQALAALDRLPDGEFLAINVSPQTVLAPQLAELFEPGSHPRLVLEITEHAKVDDYGPLARCLQGPRRAGLRIASDDTGAGYASLQHILRLAPEIMKLDMSLTRSLDSDNRRRGLVAALVAFANEVDAVTVAEGIETESELAALRGFGVTCGQGYLLGRPASLDDVLDEPAAQVSASTPTRGV